VAFSPAGKGIKIINTARTVSGRKDRLHIALRWEEEGLPTIHVSGSIGVRNRQGIGIARLNEHPERWAAENFRTRLMRAGIRVPEKADFRASVPQGAQELAQHKSPSLANIVKTMLKFSDNQIAETLLLAMSPNEESGFSGGVARVQAWLEQLGCSTNKLFTHNGSGLYEGGFGSALSVTRMLNLIHKRDDLRDGFLSALATPGRAGTLRRRMKKIPPGIVWAKTGTLNEVSTLCGFVLNKQQPMSFCVLVNGIAPKWTARARNMADSIVKTLIKPQKPSRRSARHGR
jgi:D-alanyl-D-alanine carboxypeptidase/D-alanyl-D-alanine-endopeptidase (penicillin-binding protein 4)